MKQALFSDLNMGPLKRFEAANFSAKILRIVDWSSSLINFLGGSGGLFLRVYISTMKPPTPSMRLHKLNLTLSPSYPISCWIKQFMDVAITEGSSKVTESQNYQPMAKGVRSRLWKEGYDQRIHRKKNGFNHFKLEWMVPTDRGYFFRVQFIRLIFHTILYYTKFFRISLKLSENIYFIFFVQSMSKW